ncbi:hypothetical protein Mcup_1346 [Metallosphaera cuprina Ar-4]|uniref:Uncharacterized protein n=1 Tax=Metallosphaera cuprina (strain Ar-4) TaxID=1006006 RepID=F4FY77_METCR|nr:hypothetical protein Mcup_1346 [Metallosphaera cuprina Ar-4]
MQITTIQGSSMDFAKRLNVRKPREGKGFSFAFILKFEKFRLKLTVQA